jgi:hypothetical protein
LLGLKKQKVPRIACHWGADLRVNMAENYVAVRGHQRNDTFGPYFDKKGYGVSKFGPLLAT